MFVYFLYSSIVLISVFFAYYSSNKVVVSRGLMSGHGDNFKKMPFFLSFFTLTLFIVFTDTGADYYSYYRLIENRHEFSDIQEFRAIEPLFTVWAHYGWDLFNDAHIVIVTFKVTTLVVFFISIYLLRSEIDIFSAVFAYASISYLTSFTLIRIVLASSFVTLAVVLLIKKKNNFFVLASMACGIGLHYSCIMPLLAIITYYLTLKLGKNKKSRGLIIGILVISITLIVTQASSLMTSFISVSESFEHYQKFVDRMQASASLGMLAVLLLSYALIFYLIYRTRNWVKDGNVYYLMLILSIFAFVFEFIGLRVPVMERVIYNFISVYCIVLPLCLFKYKANMPKSSGRQMSWLVFLFFAIRFFFVIRGRALPDSPSELYNYNFFNPFI